MKGKLRSILLYFSLVILPTLGISTLFFSYHWHKMQQESKETAHSALFLYRDYLDHHIGEAISALEMLAMVFSAKAPTSDEEIAQLLQGTDKTDGRFSGFYYANPDAVITLASSPLPNPIDVSDRMYARETLKQKKTTVSSAITDRVLGHRAILIATPIFNQDENITGLLMASLDFEHIASSLNAIKPQYHFEVTDQYNITFLEDDNVEETDKHVDKLTTNLTNLPWEVSIYSQPIDNVRLYRIVFTESLITLFLINILFLVTQNVLLKRQTELEKHQNEAQKLELVGTLAASTAHEIRNPLTGIKGFITLLKEKHTNEQDQLYFSIIEQEIERINEIVSEFLILGKPTAVIENTYDLREVVREVSLIIQSEANLHSIEFIIRMPEQPVLIRCSKDHIKQVILNIAKNSLEAMSSGDKLTIDVRKDASKAQLQIIDTGKGMSEYIQNHIFEPFFTSKDTGTGLGLVICKRIIEMYKGQIVIDSKEHEGTVVNITLPLHSA